MARAIPVWRKFQDTTNITSNDNAVNYEHYGDILYKLGDKKNAVQKWKKAKQLGGASKFIDQKIKDEKLYE